MHSDKISDQEYQYVFGKKFGITMEQGDPPPFSGGMDKWPPYATLNFPYTAHSPKLDEFVGSDRFWRITLHRDEFVRFDGLRFPASQLRRICRSWDGGKRNPLKSVKSDELVGGRGG